ncbi:MAG: hypothetical protein IKZ07_00785 [Akkermansia sp.]|nr:hypothetical protein [Akkermansia sp.]
MYRRYRPRRKSTGHTLPLAAVGLTVAALIIWAIFAKGDDIIRFFKGETVYVHDNSEANDNLERLLSDLSGDKARLLELAEDSKTRLGWIKNTETRRQFRWFLMCRLIDKGLWAEAVRILPEVEALAPVEGLDRLAEAALEHEDYDLQIRLDSQLLDKATTMPGATALLLRSIRRLAHTYIRMHKNDEAVKVLSRLEMATVLARLTDDPVLAAEAAELQMLRAEVGGVRDHALQLVRNILDAAHWPSCPATAKLMLEEVASTLRDNRNLSNTSLKDVEAKLLRCRDAMLEYPDREHKLPECYTMLGELRYRMGEYEGCAQALNLAGAFAEGYGEMTPELQLRLARLRSRANEACGAVSAAMVDCRYLLEHEKDQTEVFRCLNFLAAHSEGAEKIELLSRCWDMIRSNPEMAKSSPISMADIAASIATYYEGQSDYTNAIKWVNESVALVEQAHPDLTDGKLLRARMELALIERKTGKNDWGAVVRLRDIVRAIEAMSEEERARLDAADSKLYRSAVREFARTYLFTGDTKLAKQVIRKIKESLPEKVR